VTTSRSTSARPATSTSRPVTTTAKTNKNISTSRR
jgi:hypothetical protein